MPTFLDLQDDAALLSLEHQLHLMDTVGTPPWEVDLAVPRFGFGGDRPLTASAVHLLGSAAPGPRSWLWSWANPTGYHPEVTWLAEQLRDFGVEHGIAELARPEVPFDDLPGSPTEPGHVVSLMTEAAKAVTRRWTGYQGPVGGGTRVGMLIEHPSFVLPAPEGPRVSRVLQQGIAELRFHDQRRGFRSYARNRGLRLRENETQMHIEGPAFAVTTAFDEHGRVAAMTVDMRGATRQ
ncbi:DUF6882 domain-containing protein [Actinophytocola glycyrrhizae]|uniref:DUF6882 domain-containing protein n=1 Tax=Actinophytocola glycyrrhizae TaxID=2044873 RepID=A0ABV9RY51_9PSEU